MVKIFILKLFRRFISIFESLISRESSSKKLAISVSVGLFIAFSPFLFTHTIMVIVFAWAFSLNVSAVFAGAFVNNPWTLIPCHLAGYYVGDFFLRTVCRLDPFAINPSWMLFVNNLLYRFTGLKGISFWSFFIGGNLLAILVSVILYPVFKVLFSYLSKRIYSRSVKTVVIDYENSCSKQKSVSRIRYFRTVRSRDCSDR